MNVKVLFTIFYLIVLISFSRSVFAGCTDENQLKGVNVAGAEFAHDKTPGLIDRDYVYPTKADLVYFKESGANVIRLPFLWERIQLKIGEPLNVAELNHVRNVLNWASQLNLCVILDIHNFGKYKGISIGDPQVPIQSFIDLWVKLALTFSDVNVTAIGLMNEPSSIPLLAWSSIAQQTTTALRSAGSKHLVFVSSGRWSGAHEFNKPFNGVSNASLLKDFKDPLNLYAIELHQYADINYSGTSTHCIDGEQLREILGNVSRWAIEHKAKLFLGEFGVSRSIQCQKALNSMLQAMQDSKAWLGWTYWAAGQWWGNYPFSIQPSNGEESPQFKILKQYFK